LSLQQYGDVLKKSKLSSDTRQVAMVQRTGNRIAKAAEDFLAETGAQDQIKNYKWEFNLIEDDKTVNAWLLTILAGQAVPQKNAAGKWCN